MDALRREGFRHEILGSCQSTSRISFLSLSLLYSSKASLEIESRLCRHLRHVDRLRSHAFDLRLALPQHAPTLSFPSTSFRFSRFLARHPFPRLILSRLHVQSPHRLVPRNQCQPCPSRRSPSFPRDHGRIRKTFPPHSCRLLKPRHRTWRSLCWNDESRIDDSCEWKRQRKRSRQPFDYVRPPIRPSYSQSRYRPWSRRQDGSLDRT